MPSHTFFRSLGLRQAICAIAIVIAAAAMHAAPLAGGKLKRESDSVATWVSDASTARQTADRLLAMNNDAELEAALFALGHAIVSGKRFAGALALHDALVAKRDHRALLIALYLRIRTHEQIPQSSYSLTKNLAEFPDAMCDQMVAFLSHDDPVVQAMAEWAIAQRVKKHDGSALRVDQLFVAGFPKPAWYKAWKARDVRKDLTDDYARQLVQLNRHLTVAGALAAVQQCDTALRGLLADPGSRAPAAQLAAYDAALKKARDYCGSPGADLSRAHAAYLAVRRLARDVIVAARPEFPSDGFVFYTNPSLTGGVWNVNVNVTNTTNAPFGELYVKRGADPAQPAEPLIKRRLGDGSVRGADLVWEGDRVLFSFWKQPINGEKPLGWSATGNAGLHEVSLRDGVLRTITDPVGVNDVEPSYLPDGGYVFASDRSSYGNQCAGPILQNKRCTTLYRLHAAPGSQPIAISNNKDFDRHPHVLNDGTIVFLHWEYQERGLYTSHNVWRSRPDGTNMDAYYKQHISAPMSIRDVRQAPESELHVATTQGHHDGMNGPLILFNPSLGINNTEAMWLLTPGCSPIEGGEGPLAKQIVAGGGVPNRGGSYANPFPLTDRTFLAAGDLTGSESEFVVYYLDVWGNRELLHKDDDMSCFMPQALRPRKRPPVVADTVKPDANHATAFLEDVYRDLPGVKRGDVKYLRMSQSLMLPAPVYTDEERGGDLTRDYNHLHYLPGDATARHFGYWQWSPSRMIGLVKVEDDGSAYFKVPAGTPVYLQALDENLTEVRRMRTSFTLQRGEFRSCTGCHESRLETVGNRRPLPKATLAKGPQTPVPPPWGETTVLDFEKHIQPILNTHCVSCHGKESPGGGIELTARKIGGFAQSYRAMFGLKPDDPTPVTEVDWHLVLNPDAKDAAYTDKKQAQAAQIAFQTNKAPGQLILISDRQGDSSITQPRQFGSGVSKLTRTLLDDPKHRDAVRAKMTPDEWLMFVTWIDFNAVYHGTLFDVSHYNKTKTFTRVPYEIPSVWVPGDVNPTFHNKALNRR